MRRDLTDAEKMVAWVREAADELENAHAMLDVLGAPAKSKDGTPYSLAARIARLGGIPHTTEI